MQGGKYLSSNYKKVTVYPFNGDFIAFVIYLNKHSEVFQVTELVSPKGLGICGKDAGEIYNKPKVGLIVSDDFTQALENSDILLIAENNFNKSYRPTIIKNIVLAIENKKHIICTMELSNAELEMFNNSSKKSGVIFKYSPKETSWEHLKYTLNLKSSRLYTPQAAVVFVGELVDGIDGFNVLLSVTDYLKSNGFKTLSIGARNYCELLGLLSLPSILFQTDIYDNEKVNCLNHYIRYLDETEKPDVFVIQLPGGMMKYNDHFTNGFGITPYLISQAIQGDYFILCTQYDTFDAEFYNMLSNCFKYRYGFEIDYICMSNSYIDFSDSMGLGKLTYLHIEQQMLNETINRYYKNSKIPIYNIDNSLDKTQMFKKLQEILSYDNAAYQMV